VHGPSIRVRSPGRRLVGAKGESPSSDPSSYLACSAYPGIKARFRGLPPNVQLAILNQGHPTPGRSCFVGSGYQQACRNALQGGGVHAGALATLGF